VERGEWREEFVDSNGELVAMVVYIGAYLAIALTIIA
jgi:hypothetical protein